MGPEAAKSLHGKMGEGVRGDVRSPRDVGIVHAVISLGC